MGTVYNHVLRFKKKYPFTIGWRLAKNSEVVEKHLNPGEKVLYGFIAQKNDNPINILTSSVVVLTNKRLLLGRKRVVFGYFLDAITPDMFDDMKVSSGVIWGKVYIESVKELVVLSNISKNALREIETAISSYMMEEKKKYVSKPRD